MPSAPAAGGGSASPTAARHRAFRVALDGWREGNAFTQRYWIPLAGVGLIGLLLTVECRPPWRWRAGR